MNNDMKQSLQVYCASALSEKKDVQISDLDCISAGWESDVYSFTVEHGLTRHIGLTPFLPGNNNNDENCKVFRFDPNCYPTSNYFSLHQRDSVTPTLAYHLSYFFRIWNYP